MKRKPLVLMAAAGLLAAVLGCGHVDLAPEGAPDRVTTGTVNVRVNLLPPPDAEVVVRVVEPADVTDAPMIAGKDIVIGESGTRARPETVVAEQVIHAPAAMPVPFRLEYRASDARLQRGLNLEARLSWGGRVRFRTIESQAITLASASVPQTMWVEPVQ